MEKLFSRVKELWQASPVAVAMALTWKLMPFQSRLLVIVYLLLWILYKLVPWKYKKLAVSKEASLESFRKLVRGTHILVIVLLFAMPLLAMGTFQLRHWIPICLESVITDAANDKRLEALAVTRVTYSPTNLSLTNAPLVYIALVQPNTATNNTSIASMFGTQSIFLISTEALLSQFISILQVICYLVAVCIFAVFMAEILYGVFYGIQQKLAQNASQSPLPNQPE